ncbi:unnamed protein product [Prorocentrum cordatum]|uniref:Photosystem II cytochrome b559 N-terminal domain-containing protein n=1 Tax=Prorocentrum cordatum TaxID=2364126 RepID=A0ABN9XT14_9DINO|nr:unnamed protein product [Polarella glacialis]
MASLARVAALLALAGGACAFVPSAGTANGRPAQAAAPVLAAGAGAAPASAEPAPWGASVLAGLGLGYAAAVAAKAKTACRAEPKPQIAAARTPVAYPIFTFRWLAVHMLAVPTVFFLGAISSMQFIQR